ncbi:MAG TPA: AI-2E family transporter [Gemmatimonadaceae bacterium]|nr:AI-2E family transporter [Gemmatimonadaceae bacterium]
MSNDSGRRFKFAPILTATVLTVLGLWLFARVAQVLILLFIGVLLSLYLRAVAGWFERRWHFPERFAFLTSLLLSLAGVVAIFYILVPPVISQTQALIKVLPNYITGWEDSLERTISRVPALREFWPPGQHKILGAVYNEVSGTFATIPTRVLSVVQGAISIFSISVIAIYLSLHPALYREWLIALFPPIHRDLVRDLLGDLGDTLRSYIVGQLLVMAFLAALTAIFLYILNVPFALTFGIFTGLVAIIPFFGTLLSTTLPALFVLNTPNGGIRALAVLGVGVVVHLIEGNIVSPYAMSKKVDLPPVLTIMSVLIMGQLLGGIGLIVALPTLAMVMVIVRRILITRIYEGQGFRRTTRERPLVLRLPAPGGGVLVPAGQPIDVVSIAEHTTTNGRHITK